MFNESRNDRGWYNGTASSYDQGKIPVFLVRVTENDSTPSGANIVSLFGLPTGATYSPPPVASLLHQSNNLIADVANSLPAINEELDGYVDRLIEATYLGNEQKPLVRRF